MIKKTLYFGNPVYLSLRNAQLVIKLPDVEKATVLPETLKKQAEVTKPIEDIGILRRMSVFVNNWILRFL